MGHADEHPSVVAMRCGGAMRRILSRLARFCLLSSALSALLCLPRSAYSLDPPALKPPPPAPDKFIEGEELRSVDQLWSEPGFRLSLHGLYGALYSADLYSADQELDASLKGVEVSAGARLSPQWSLSGRLQYALAEGTRLSGLHFNASLEPSLQVTSWLSVSASLGLAGIIEFDDIRADQQAELNGQLVAPYDHPQGDPPLARCEGFGRSEALRLNLRYLLGAHSALSAGVYVSHQLVTCLQSTDRVEPDSATPIERRQRWEHLSWGVTGGFSWR